MRIYAKLCALLLLPGLAFAEKIPVTSDVDFKGTLVDEPCTLVPGGEGDNVVVDFGVIAEKTFYTDPSRRTWLQPFHILLKDCDLSLGKQVKITFTGTEDSEQPGLLAVTSSAGVAHIAVGLQNDKGAELPVNKQSDAYALSEVGTQLNFKAYIQASEDGVRNKSVGLGVFEATSTFELEYP